MARAPHDTTSLGIGAMSRFGANMCWHGAAAEKEQPQVDPQGERGGVHQFGVPPKGNANFAWVQHFIHHLAPQGMAGFVLANGSMSSNQSGEGDIRRALIEADLVDCMVALPGQLFYSTQIPVCLWSLAKNKAADAKRGFRVRLELGNQLPLAA
jgi:type I restriction-modification system DNA methylase subunit